MYDIFPDCVTFGVSVISLEQASNVSVTVFMVRDLQQPHIYLLSIRYTCRCRYLSGSGEEKARAMSPRLML